MRMSHPIFLALGLAGSLIAGAAVAADPTFFNESKPMFDNCGDGSLAKAQKDGVTLGFSNNPPEAWLDESTKQPTGIDWDINKAALDWMGVKTIKIEWMPWESQIPALLSKRTDVIAGNIHHTPERDKVISFSGPAYWYGPVIIVAKGNPLGIKSYDDLKGKKVGGISGSAAEFYLRKVGADLQPFKAEVEELQSLNQGRLEAVLEDDLVYLQFNKTNPGNNLEPLWNIAAPDDIINGGGYGMARFAVRKEDCTLRSAYTQALAEMRANGQVSYILKKYGLSDRNLVFYKLNP
ncbi:MAG TPA: transporter substrate-binding domain-containing protein [Alphaproteobacteria bacterium]|nr:transporter substrate-binding domain-containing protein [Alphaproteobacteria bacterium]